MHSAGARAPFKHLLDGYHTVVCSDGVERHLASPSLPPSLVVPNGLEARSVGFLSWPCQTARSARTHADHKRLRRRNLNRSFQSVACQPVSVDMLGLVGTGGVRRDENCPFVRSFDGRDWRNPPSRCPLSTVVNSPSLPSNVTLASSTTGRRLSVRASF